MGRPLRGLSIMGRHTSATIQPQVVLPQFFLKQPQVVRRASPGLSGSQRICLNVATIDPPTPYAKRGPNDLPFIPSFRDRYGIKSFSR